MKIPAPFLKTGRTRVVIEHLSPSVDNGRYPAKRTTGEWVVAEADLFIDGHDHITAVLMHRKKGERKWQEKKMDSIGNDRYRASFQCEEEGYYEFTFRGFVNHAETWRSNLLRRLGPEQDQAELKVQIAIGMDFLDRIGKRYAKARSAVKRWKEKLESHDALQCAISDELSLFLQQFPLSEFDTLCDQVLQVAVHREKARFSSWYSFFPRSASEMVGRHGTFNECIALLPRIQAMGFDVVYLPPVHPIGFSYRKGKNNSLNASPDDEGCPYAIGSDEGGHTEILDKLGTLDDFKNLISATRELGMELAMDYAIQCAPDHPFVKQHPQWFKWRPDGTVQYAENPPKKYQDVLPLDFENDDWQNMWVGLYDILEYWINVGIKIFRVDNPHTKTFLFWEWCMSEIAKKHPEVIFLSEAFSRPRIMEGLAKKGFHQSYTYFTWRTTKYELTHYMEELTHGPMRDFFRPNFWPNTHDINPYHLQSGHEPQFIIRYFLCAALSSNYGIFGPSFELMIHSAVPGKEEYLNSEKYEIRHWNWSATNKLIHVISMMNKFRKENVALQHTNNYVACHVDNDHMMAWLKCYGDNKILCVINLDAYHRQSATLHLPLENAGLTHNQTYVVHDLFTDDRFMWHGSSNYVDLDPYGLPFHLFRIESI
jgi:starch synthase (maltosyl-transferring)